MDYKESLKEDLHRDPKDLEEEADRARGDVEHTLDALGRRLSPGEMLDQVVRKFKHEGGDFGSNLAAHFRNNPWPALLTGAGLIWLIASSRRTSDDDYYYETGYDEEAQRSGALRERASRLTSSAQRMAGGAAEAAQRASDRVGEAAHRAGDRVARASRAGARRMREYGREYGDVTRDQPLLLGALAVAAGAAIGALLPVTEVEERWYGEARDAATERMREAARSRAADVKAAAAEAATAAKQRLQQGKEHTNGREAQRGSDGGSTAPG
jgi:hypothetical protein